MYEYRESLSEKIYDLLFICPIHYLLRILLKRKDPNTETRLENIMNAYLYRPASQLLGRGKLRTKSQSRHLWVIRQVFKITNDYNGSRSIRLQRKAMRAEFRRLERVMDEADSGALKPN